MFKAWLISICFYPSNVKDFFDLTKTSKEIKLIFQGFVLFIKVKCNFKKRFKNFGSVSSPDRGRLLYPPCATSLEQKERYWIRIILLQQQAAAACLAATRAARRWRRPQQASFTGRHYRHERLFGGAVMGTAHIGSFDKKLFHSTIPAL